MTTYHAAAAAMADYDAACYDAEEARRHAPPRGYCPGCGQKASGGYGWRELQPWQGEPRPDWGERRIMAWGGHWYYPCPDCNPDGVLPEGVA